MDLLDMLDADADVTPTKTMVKDAYRQAIFTVCRRDGDFDAARVRAEVPEIYRKSPLAGTTTTGMLRAGLIEPTGRFAQLGNTEHRAGLRPTHIYRLTEKGEQEARTP